MLGIGMSEMILIAVIALIVFGPEKFPDFAKIALRTMRDLRGYVDEIQGEVTKELNPIKKELNKLSKDSEKYIEKIAKETEQAVSPPATPAAPAAAASVSQADPTDRQDDSYHYGPQNTSSEDPYGLRNTEEEGANGSGIEDAAPPASTGEEKNDAPDSVENQDNGDGDRDEFDLSEPPVERMD
jgi:sec-independent protein translocase protein TatB